MFSFARHPVLLLSLLTLPFLLLLSACATLFKPLSDQDVEVILSRIEEQDKKVFSFYTSGSLSIHDWNWESEAHVLIAGRRNPFKIKIEVTHPWGRPILHILIEETSLQVLSFPEKKLYRGAFTPEALSRFIPGDFDAPLVWAVLRGYPHLRVYHRTKSLKSNQIRLFNDKGKVVEIVNVEPESQLPSMVFLPEQDMSLAFSDMQELNGVYYARQVRVEDMEGKRNLVLKNKKMVFNKTIPEQVFLLEKPPSFGTYHLDENTNKASP